MRKLLSTSISLVKTKLNFGCKLPQIGGVNFEDYKTAKIGLKGLDILGAQFAEGMSRVILHQFKLEELPNSRLLSFDLGNGQWSVEKGDEESFYK